MQAHKGSKARKKRSGPEVKEKGQRPAKHSQKKAQSNSDPEADRRPGENKQKPARQVKQECTQRVIDEMGEIVDGLIEKAKDGSCQHAKFLFDFAGVEAGGVGEAGSPGREGEPLTELLLRRLDAAAAGSAPQRVNNGRAGDPAFVPASTAVDPQRVPADKETEFPPPQAQPWRLPAEPGGIRLEQNGEAAGLG